jgi:hypothetical protein
VGISLRPIADKLTEFAGKLSKISTAAKTIALSCKDLALVAGILYALFKPTDTAPTKKSYEALSQNVRELSSQIEDTHDDVTNLREFVNGYVKGTASAVASQATPVAPAPVTSSSAVAPAVNSSPPASTSKTVPTTPDAGTPRNRRDLDPEPVSAAMRKPASEPAPAPSPKPRRVEPENFEHLMEKVTP